MPAPIEHSSARNRFAKNPTRKFFCGRVGELLALSRFADVDSPHVIRFRPLGAGPGGFYVPQSGSLPGRWAKVLIRAECLENARFRENDRAKDAKKRSFWQNGPSNRRRLDCRAERGRSRLFCCNKLNLKENIGNFVVAWGRSGRSGEDGKNCVFFAQQLLKKRL
jgi:hypothetical protein